MLHHLQRDAPTLPKHNANMEPYSKYSYNSEFLWGSVWLAAVGIRFWTVANNLPGPFWKKSIFWYDVIHPLSWKGGQGWKYRINKITNKLYIIVWQLQTEFNGNLIILRIWRFEVEGRRGGRVGATIMAPKCLLKTTLCKIYFVVTIIEKWYL